MGVLYAKSSLIICVIGIGGTDWYPGHGAGLHKWVSVNVDEPSGYVGAKTDVVTTGGFFAVVMNVLVCTAVGFAAGYASELTEGTPTKLGHMCVDTVHNTGGVHSGVLVYVGVWLPDIVRVMVVVLGRIEKIVISAPTERVESHLVELRESDFVFLDDSVGDITIPVLPPNNDNEELAHRTELFVEKDVVESEEELEYVVVMIRTILTLDTPPVDELAVEVVVVSSPFALPGGVADWPTVGKSGLTGLDTRLGGFAMLVGGTASIPETTDSKVLVEFAPSGSGGAGLASGGIYGSDTGLGSVMLRRPPPPTPPPGTADPTADFVGKYERVASAFLSVLLVAGSRFTYRRLQ
jgi:hypothetical protein